jgi:hypothetical protein
LEISDWATRLAEVAAPEEVDLAPFIVEAYVKGGERRAKLFDQSGRGIAGGIGVGGSVSILAWILRGIVVSAQCLYSILSSEGTSNFLAVIKELLGLAKEARPTKKQRLASMPDDPYKPLKRTIEIMATELRERGLPEDQADAITLQVIYSLLKEPADAELFIRQLESR